MEEKLLTLHPDPTKTGVNISKSKYDTVRSAILDSLQKGPLTFGELGEAVEKQLSGNFDGSVMWYYTTVKLDLEARKMIERNGRSPQKIHLVS